MSIEQQVTVEVLSVDVADDYSIEIMARDVLTGDEATVNLSWDEAHAHVDEVLATIAQAQRAFEEDRVAAVTHRPSVNGFDRDVPVCQDCSQGKHGACIGSAFVENGPDLDEVACRCTADGHRGRS
jgi:hypothetical protein